jgi:hemerythrin
VECQDVDVDGVLAGAAPTPASAGPLLDGKAMYSATGFMPIDRQHLALSEAIEAFFEMLSTGRSEEVQVAFETIIGGIAVHFADEERLMRAHRFPGLARHAEAHARFVEESRRLLVELERGGVTVPFRRWAVGRLPEWFRLHILEHDVALGQFLERAGVTEEQVEAVAG